MTKHALITGITGQDGAYLAQLLLEKTIPSMASSPAGAPIPPVASTNWVSPIGYACWTATSSICLP